MRNLKTHDYRPMANPTEHTCWDNDNWDGVIMDGCAGCEEAMQHPCRYCGFGACFATHSDEAHRENGDVLVPDDATEAWTDAPHIYTEMENN